MFGETLRKVIATISVVFKMKRALLYLVSFPADVLAFVCVCGLMRALWGKRVEWKRGVFWMELDPQSWFYRQLYAKWGASTFGHVILVAADHLEWVDHSPEVVASLRATAITPSMRPTHRDIVLTDQLAMHELTHVEAYEAIALVLAAGNGLWLLAGGPWWVALLVQIFGGVASFAAAMATAWLRGEHPYLGSYLEEAARTRVTCKNNPDLSASARIE